MRAALILTTLAILLAGCGDNEGASTPAPDPAPVGYPNTAGINGDSLKLVDSVASWNSEDKTLAVVFATWQMTDEERKKTVDTKNSVVINPPDKPYIKALLELDEPANGLNPANVKNWRVVYCNLGETSPLTMGGNLDSQLVELSGDLKAGGVVKVKLFREDQWNLAESPQTYYCNVDSEATLLWAE